MSRTLRRKHYVVENNTTWDRIGKKTALEFTANDGYWGYGRLKEFRPMDKEERCWQILMMYGESRTACDRSPCHWHRLFRQKQNRSINKKEFNRWSQYAGEYEPMFEDRPRSCWWDWS